jgi:two-component system, OmpR family, response regulator BaeR
MLSAGQKILIVEDDEKIADLLSDYLKDSGFVVSALYRGDQVVQEVILNPPDLILLDIILPGKDGMTICRELRAFSRIPILILSGKAEEIDRLMGLELGADDYICKPFSLREVVARVKAILRRVVVEPKDEKLTVGPISINLNNHNATIEGRNLRLTPVEFELLRIMSLRPHDVFTRDDLLSRIGANNSDHPRPTDDKKMTECNYDYERTIDSHIKNLRKKLGKILPDNNLIRTVYGIGYSLKIPQDSFDERIQ